MDKSLSQEEIDALFKQASDGNNVSNEEQNKIDELSNYLYDQNQDMIKNIIEQKEQKIDELSNYLYNQNQNMIQDIINNENNDDIKDEYLNSPYYANYLYVYNNIDKVLEPYQQYIVQRHLYNINYYGQDTTAIDVAFAINYIGSNIPSELINALKEKMNIYLKSNDALNDLDFDIKFTSFEYINPNELKIYRKMDGYRIDISAVKNIKQNKIK